MNQSISCPLCLRPMQEERSTKVLKLSQHDFVSAYKYDFKIHTCSYCGIDCIQIDNSTYWKLPEQITPTSKQINTVDAITDKGITPKCALITKYDYSEFIRSNINVLKDDGDDYDDYITSLINEQGYY